MLTQYLSPVLVLLLFCAACSTEHTAEIPQPSPEKQEIKDFLEQYYTTMSDRDWPAYQDMFWEKATLTTVWQKPGDSTAAVHITTIDEFIAQTPQGPDSQPIFEERMQQAEIEVRGNLARAWVSYSAKFGSEEQLHEWEGLDLFTFMRQDDRWRIVALAYE